MTFAAAFAKMTATVDEVITHARDTSIANMVATGMDPDDAEDLLRDLEESYVAAREQALDDVRALLLAEWRGPIQ